MAKIKKRKLCWSASASSQVVGYKLYWSEGNVPDYDSSCEMLGNVTEIILPDDVDSFTPKEGPITFGVTAVDELGNESDMVLLKVPYQFNVPKAPDDLHLKALNDYYTSNGRQGISDGDRDVDHDEPVESTKPVNQIYSGLNDEESEISRKFSLMIERATTL